MGRSGVCFSLVYGWSHLAGTYLFDALNEKLWLERL